MSINIVELLCKLLSIYLMKKKQEEAIDLILEVCIKMLEGGNLECQERFLEVFKDSQNLKVIEKIHYLLNEKLGFFSKLMTNQNSDTFQNMIHGDHHYNDYTKKNAEDPKSVENFCIQIFKFLQLLCEGHNNRLQNYLRNQVCELSEEDRKTVVVRNFDLIQLTVEYFGSYSKFFNV